MAEDSTPVSSEQKRPVDYDMRKLSEDGKMEQKEYLETYNVVLSCVKSMFDLSRDNEHKEESLSEDMEEPQSKTELSKVLSQICGLVNHEKPQTQFTCVPDHYTHINIIGKTLSLYLSLLDEACVNKLSACIKSDCSHWLSKLFGYENALCCFHEHQWDGLVRVCRLALRLKYPKFGTEGFTALYTRPPVVYISSSACNSLGHYLCTQLGLPQSSVCKVPCNTVFGSTHTMDIAAFERLFNDDVSCGKTPLLLIAYAGTPLAGHTDNLSRLRELCTQNGLWLHLEGDTLATLCLETVPASLKSAPACDSMSLNISKWFALPSAPYCTFYRAKDLVLAEASGLSQSHTPDRLSVLPLWISIQTIGLDKMQEMILHAAQLSQQLCVSLDGMQAAVKRIAQPHCMSSMVVFQYKAAPVSPSGSILQTGGEEDASDQDEEQDDTELSSSSRSSSPEPGCVSSSVRDAINQMIAKYLAQQVPSVKIGVVNLPKEGCCIRFNPVLSSRICGTTNENVEDFVICLKEEVARLDNLLLSQEEFRLATEGKEHVVAVEIQDTSAVGALLCVPRYWTNKDLGKLREAKKVELNDWNKEVLAKVSEGMEDVFSKGRTQDGLTCITIDKVPATSSVDAVVDIVCKGATELETSSKYLEQMADAIQRGIEAAQQDLVKESEEKLLEEGLLRQVPLVSSFVNWLSPLPEEPKTIGRTFNLTSGNLHKTEKIYKYHMQVQDEDDEEAVPVTPTKSSPEATPVKESPAASD
ncbi:unnamed protein product [Pocillopora meandrina]|uniref:Pyridoxal-dependent decarboxylase domain-containing protein 1 n=1 Tax=Pocillopora meandrina TaxID=46732 RepID=A0AAU9VYI8_9CNID|nr:unnamed protein product [Pocillopora meandrina]